MIDQYLNYLYEQEDEKYVSESIFLYVPLYIIMKFALALIEYFIFMLRSSSGKEDKSLSKELNKILKNTGNRKWKVIILNNKEENAYAYFNKTIYITKGLIKKLTRREKIAVLIHEVSHVVNKDVLKSELGKTTIGAMLAGVIFAAPPVTLIFIFPMIVYISSGFYKKIWGRKHELRADSLAVKLGYRKEIASALKKMESGLQKMLDQLGKSKADKLIIKIFLWVDEHPPLKDRLENILKSEGIYKAMLTKNINSIKSIVKKGLQIKLK